MSVAETASCPAKIHPPFTVHCCSHPGQELHFPASFTTRVITWLVLTCGGRQLRSKHATSMLSFISDDVQGDSRDMRWVNELPCGRDPPSIQGYNKCLPYNKRLFCLSHYTCLGLLLQLLSWQIPHSVALCTDETMMAKSESTLPKVTTTNSAKVKNFSFLTIWSRFAVFNLPNRAINDS